MSFILERLKSVVSKKLGEVFILGDLVSERIYLGLYQLHFICLNLVEGKEFHTEVEIFKRV